MGRGAQEEKVTDGQSKLAASCHLFIFRRRDGQGEWVASFVYSDLAEMAARAICERLKYPTEVRFDDTSFKPTRYEWRTVERDAVVDVS